jgi:hypothetical protein
MCLTKGAFLGKKNKFDVIKMHSKTIKISSNKCVLTTTLQCFTLWHENSSLKIG